MANEVVIKLRMEGDNLIVSGVGKVSAGMDAMGKSAVQAGEKTQAGMAAARRGVQSISTQLEKLQSLAAGYIGFQALSALARQATEASLSMDRMARTIEFASTSAADYAVNTDFVRTRVRELGLEINSAGGAFAKLSAAAKNTALEGDGARSIFDAVSKASTVMGLSADDTAGSLLAISQMISKGTVSSEELRGQLGERLPGAFQMAARAMGVTTQQLGKMLEQGEITTDVFLPRFAAQMRTEMAGSVDKAADSVQANLNRVATSWTNLLGTVNNSTFTNELLKGVDTALTGIDASIKSQKDEWPRLAEVVARSMAFAADSVAALWATVQGLGREAKGLYETTALWLRKQAALVADSQLTGGKNQAAIKKQFEAEQAALDAGYNADMQRIYAGLDKFRTAVDAEVKARQDRANRLSLDGRARSAIRAGDGIQAFLDEELLRTKAVTGAAEAKEKAAKAFAKARAEAIKEVAKAYDDSGKAASRYYADLANNDDALEKSNKKLAEETALIGLSEQAKAALTLARMDAAIATEQEALALLNLQNSSEIEIAAAERHIRLLKERRSLIRSNLEAKAADSLADAGERAAKDLAEANRKAAEESGKFWEDALMRAFESGKGFFQSLWDTIKNTLKTQVLKVLVTVGMGALGGLVSAATGTDAGTSIMGTINGASAANSIYGWATGYNAGVNTVAGWLGYGSAAGAGAGTLGYANAMGLAGGDGLGAFIASNGSWEGVSVAATESMWASAEAIEANAAILMEAGATATEASLAATTAAEAASSTPALPGAGPYGWIAAAVIAAWAYATQQGETRSGGQYTYNKADGVSLKAGPSGGEISGTKLIIDGTVAGINGMFKNIGSSLYVTGFQAGIETSNNNRGGVFAGGTLSNGATFGESGIGDNYAGTLYDKSYGFELNQGEAQKYFVQDMGAATIEALQVATDIPKVISEMVKGYSTKPKYLTQESIAEKGEQNAALLTDINAVVTGVNAFRDSLKSMPFKQLEGMSFDAASSLMAASAGARAVGESMDQYLGRGLQNLQNNLQGFYENFYTQSEQTANLTRNVTEAFAAQNIAMPAAGTNLRDWYRTLVETAMALDQSVPANASFTASILALQGPMNQLAPAFEDLAGSISDLISDISTRVDNIQFGFKYGLQDRQGQYAMVDEQAYSAYDSMLGSTSVQDVARYGNRTLDLLEQSWDLLSPEQQAASYDQYMRRTQEVEDFMVDWGADTLSQQEASNDALADTVATAVENAIAKAMAPSATAMQATADKADRPVVVESTINVNVTSPPSVEVSIEHESNKRQ